MGIGRVGLRRPDDVLSSVTTAVDATAAVVDEVPDGGLLLADRPLLLRGVDAVAASTAKGALVHRLIRSGRSLFPAHSNADSASPGVSDALAHALGLTVEAVLSPCCRVRAGQVGDIGTPGERGGGAGSGVCGRRRRSQPGAVGSVTGTGQFLPGDGASPAVGSVGAVEQVVEDRVEVIAPARPRRAVLSAMRAAHPYEEPAFDIFALAPLPADVGLGRIGSLEQPESLSTFVSRVGSGLPQTSWGIRAAGDPDMTVSRVAVCGGAGDSLLDVVAAADVQAYVTSDLRHHPADEHRRASDVALIDVAHWASEYPWCEQAADTLRSVFGADLSVRVCPIRTDPWNVDDPGGSNH